MKPVLLIVALTGLSISATASAFTVLCDTGVVSGCATQTPLGTNATDDNYTVTESPVGAPPFSATTIASNPGYFTSGGNAIGTATSSWITVFDDGDTTATGDFNYQQAIVAGVTGTVTISGNWGVDNCGQIAWGSTPVAVSGTGTSIGGGLTNCTSPLSAFQNLTSFSFTESVVSGTTYFLDFEVDNTGDVTGLLVDSLAATAGASAVPEPSSLLLLGSALFVGAAFRARRRA